jgi:hypothetical protein
MTLTVFTQNTPVDLTVISVRNGGAGIATDINFHYEILLAGKALRRLRSMDIKMTAEDLNRIIFIFASARRAFDKAENHDKAKQCELAIALAQEIADLSNSGDM